VTRVATSISSSSSAPPEPPTIITNNRDTADWLALIDDPLLAQSAVDRFKNNAYDLVIDGPSYRERLKPHVDKDESACGSGAQAAAAPTPQAPLPRLTYERLPALSRPRRNAATVAPTQSVVGRLPPGTMTPCPIA